MFNAKSNVCRRCTINHFPITLHLSLDLQEAQRFLACYLHPTSLITLQRYFGFVVSDCIFLFQCNVWCLQRVHNQSFPRYPAPISKSPGGPEALLLCYAHPTSLITLLRYFGFIVSDCMINSMSNVCRGWTINHFTVTLHLSLDLWEAQMDS